MLKRSKAASMVLLILVLAVSCGGQGASSQGSSDEGPLRVVATYSILEDLVENVGGEQIELATLVGPDSDAHTFEPSPSDGAELSEADLIFENGLGFETWLDDLYESSGSDAQRVVVTEEIEPLTAEEEEHEGEEEHAGEEHEEHEGGEEEHGEFDPHVWFDVNNTMLMVESIRDALSEADPENAEVYEANADQYLAELEGLNEGIEEQVGAIPDENRRLVTSHDTFGYFAEAYGFEVVGTALPSFSTETADPSAGEIAELVEEIEATGVPAIFAENVSNPALMEQVASEAGVELAPPLYTDALGEPGSEGATYTGMMSYDVQTIAEALR